MRLSQREVAILRVLGGYGEAKRDELERGLYAGRVARLAGFKQSSRMDAGATRTLDSMAKKKLATYKFDGAAFAYGIGGRRWWITNEGREALGEYAFGD